MPSVTAPDASVAPRSPSGCHEPPVPDLRGDEVHLPQEGRRKPALWAAIDPFCRTFILDQPVVHHHDPVGDRHRLFLIMGHMHEGRPHAPLDRLQFLLHRAPQVEVERAQRFVQQQHIRLHRQRAGQRHALPLPAR